MNELDIDPYLVLRQIERERNAYVAEGQRLRALAERRDMPAQSHGLITFRFGFVTRLRRVLATPSRTCTPARVGSAS